jgi:inorganic pyrophosphatase
VDFISPLPCPFNYGSVPSYLGLEGDLLDALVLGRRLPLGTQVRVKARGAVILIDRGMTDGQTHLQRSPPKAIGASAGAAIFPLLCKV